MSCYPGVLLILRSNPVVTLLVQVPLLLFSQRSLCVRLLVQLADVALSGAAEFRNVGSFFCASLVLVLLFLHDLRHFLLCAVPLAVVLSGSIASELFECVL